jgi:hypothetical protein
MNSRITVTILPHSLRHENSRDRYQRRISIDEVELLFSFAGT